MNGMQQGKKSHAFSIILIMVVLMLVGAIFLYTGQLKVQYNPVQENLSLSVSFSGEGSARVVETEVTSIIEGALNTVDGVSSITAHTDNGGGYISMTFKEGTNMETARFDVSTRMRQIRPKLPEGTPLPRVSGSVGGGGRGRRVLRAADAGAAAVAVALP